ncbi:hypothetical protein [Parvularcula maris]|uniref:GGDEF domain-containing protein n=1 Tax=Parvularcula maris TaxID=2965077 RepID=A0A9X2RIY5_9PROT|nr:hypothetical protein [Parvularcula maris]MCQ8186600.1 hypothetical protein [Parvularcula maris]
MIRPRQRATISVRLIGSQTDHRWRAPLLAEGFAVPAGGPAECALADLRGAENLDTALAEARRIALPLPLCVVLSLDEPLPREGHRDVVLVRLDRDRTEPLAAAIRSSVAAMHEAHALSVRSRALAACGLPLGSIHWPDLDAPAVMLAEPDRDLLPILKGLPCEKLVTPLSSSHTLRLLENQNAGALIIHLGRGNEHRLPVLKLIRRQSDLAELPVAVVCEEWTEELTASWLQHGADLLGRPSELPRLLETLQAGTSRYTVRQAVTQSLTNSVVTDEGHPSPIAGQRLFDQVVAEHRALGDRMAFGVIELHPEGGGSEHDVSEAGVYMAMALTGANLICRPRPSVFVVAMPYADKYYAGRTIRTLKTLIEDLKFGQEPDSVLISAKSAAIDGTGLTPKEAISELRTTLLQQVVDETLALA